MVTLIDLQIIFRARVYLPVPIRASLTVSQPFNVRTWADRTKVYLTRVYLKKWINKSGSTRVDLQGDLQVDLQGDLQVDQTSVSKRVDIQWA